MTDREKVLADRYYAEQEKRLREPMSPPGLDEEGEPEIFIDQREAAKVLLECNGNVTRAAEEIGVHPQRLRAFVKGSNVMKAAIHEAMEQGADKAVEILFEGLRDEGSYQNRFYAAKAYLMSEMGRKRGFGRPEAVTLDVARTGQGAPVLTVKWLDPLPLPEPEGRTIEGEKAT